MLYSISALAIVATSVSAALATSNGKILVTSGITGKTLGFLSTETFAGAFYTVGDATTAISVTLPRPICSTLSSNFLIKAPISTDYPYVGFVAPSGMEPETKNDAGEVYTVGAPATTAGQDNNADNTWSGDHKTQSALWSINCSSNVLTATWVSASGTPIPLTQINSNGQYLAAVSNLAAFKQTYYSTTDEAVTFTFIPSNALVFNH